MHILITGGAGFIGSALVRYLIRHTEHRVLNVDKLTYAGNPASLADIADHPHYTFEQADICDTAALSRIFAIYRPDAVMHLAAESHVDRSIYSAGEFIQTNIVGTFNLLEAARAHWQGLPENRKVTFLFHHISTDEVYQSAKPSSPIRMIPTTMEPIMEIFALRRYTSSIHLNSILC